VAFLITDLALLMAFYAALPKVALATSGPALAPSTP
jgi:hypothetical protein